MTERRREGERNLDGLSTVCSWTPSKETISLYVRVDGQSIERLLARFGRSHPSEHVSVESNQIPSGTRKRQRTHSSSTSRWQPGKRHSITDVLSVMICQHLFI